MSKVINELNKLIADNLPSDEEGTQRLRVIGLIHAVDARDLDAVETLIETYIKSREE